MNTSLRIDNELYRQAKVEAARRGVTITLFIEESLKLNLERQGSSRVVQLATFGGSGFGLTADQIRDMNGDEKTLSQLQKRHKR
jgi:hypothetical protein